MAEASLPRAAAQSNTIELVPLSTADGVVAYVPAAAIAVWHAQGRTTVRLDLVIDPTTIGLRKWVLLSDAARQYANTLGVTLGGAKAAVYRACEAGHVVCERHGRSRRIEVDSLLAWMNHERDRALDSDDD